MMNLYEQHLFIEHREYQGNIEYSKEDKVFHGKIQKITDLVIYEGDSLWNLIKSFIEAVDDYIYLKSLLQ
jgi:predicted HicB family RNase H-like nuclease